MTSHTTTFNQSKEKKTQIIKQKDNVITPFDPTTLTESLPLLPFQNQVGGHCSFFRFSKRAICKPMSHKERQFYEHLEQYHVPLLPFTSQYLGVVNVTYRSSNVQAMLPEVILADNQHLLANWKKVCLTSSTRYNKNQQHRKQQTTKNKRNKVHRRSISNDNSNNNNNKNHYLKEEVDIIDDDMNLTSTWSPTTFKEQVLREVFSPHALEERLRQVRDWQKGMNQNELLLKKLDLISPDPSQKPRLHSRSVLDFRQALDSSLSSPPISSSSDGININNNNDDYQHPLRLLSTSYSTNENSHSVLNNNNENNEFIFSEDNGFKNSNKINNNNNNSTDSPEVTVHPRRPTIIETTTSAPQTPRMRETRLHNPMIRPPIPSSDSPIFQPSTSPLPDSPTSSISSSSISILPSPLPSQQGDQEENIIAKIEEKEKIDKDEFDDEEKDNDDFLIKKQQQESASWRPRQAPNNPWSEQMYRRDLEKVNIDDVQQFILIEDLTDDIKYPCVLDLKMGTRQHGVYVSESKMNSQTTKCEKSTSLKLGVRISGMQIYNFLEEQFIFEDKYKGRQLTPLTFRDTLIRYFDNGYGCQVDFLPTLIRKLVLIFRIIESMDSYRFYASSLLIIYDANTSFNQIKNNNTNISSATSTSVLKTTLNTNSNISSSLPTVTAKNKIDVRLIDFAKSISKQEWFTQKHLFTYPPTDITHYHKSKEKNQEENNYGPDPGYLSGVQTLIKCFLWIYTNHGGKKEILSDLNDTISSIQSSPFWSKTEIDIL